MKKYSVCIIVCMLITVATKSMHASEHVQWSMLVYMEASSGDLYNQVFKALNELSTNTPDNTHIFVCLHASGDTAWLYKIEKNKICMVDTLIFDTASSSATIIDAMEKVIVHSPANHYALILWNHGYGILSPLYDSQTKQWNLMPDGPCGCSSRSKKISSESEHMHHRGMLTAENGQFLSNADMIETCNIISQKLGKKLDICGLDLCKGAMFEHAYQIREYVDYLIGSEECELADGWPYNIIIQALSSPALTPCDFACHIVKAYQQYYEQHTLAQTYTLSALDLQQVEAVKNNIDAVAALLIYAIQEYAEKAKDFIKNIRNSCSPFCQTPMYCDLYEFYWHMLNALRARPVKTDKALIMQALLEEGMQLISCMVKAQCVGSASDYAHGFSLYFPQFIIDPSYHTASFAQESLWLPFLQLLYT